MLMNYLREIHEECQRLEQQKEMLDGERMDLLSEVIRLQDILNEHEIEY